MVRAQTDGGGVGGVRVPASPVLFALAAAGQRWVARDRRGRADRRALGSDTRRGQRTDARRWRRPRRVLSVALAGGSLTLMAAAIREMTDAGTTVDPHAPERATRLLTTGAFALTRNPIYLGWAGLLAAHALWLGSTRALLPAGAFVLVIDRCQIPLEEAALARSFGRSYRDYAETVPRWLL